MTQIGCETENNIRQCGREPKISFGSWSEYSIDIAQFQGGDGTPNDFRESVCGQNWGFEGYNTNNYTDYRFEESSNRNSSGDREDRLDRRRPSHSGVGDLICGDQGVRPRCFSRGLCPNYEMIKSQHQSPTHNFMETNLILQQQQRLLVMEHDILVKECHREELTFRPPRMAWQQGEAQSINCQTHRGPRSALNSSSPLITDASSTTSAFEEPLLHNCDNLSAQWHSNEPYEDKIVNCDSPENWCIGDCQRDLHGGEGAGCESVTERSNGPRSRRNRGKQSQQNRQRQYDSADFCCRLPSSTTVSAASPSTSSLILSTDSNMETTKPVPIYQPPHKRGHVKLDQQKTFSPKQTRPPVVTMSYYPVKDQRDNSIGGLKIWQPYTNLTKDKGSDIGDMWDGYRSVRPFWTQSTESNLDYRILKSLAEVEKEVENTKSGMEGERKAEKASKPESKESEGTNSSEEESSRFDWKWWMQNYGDHSQDGGIRCDPNEENGDCTGQNGCCCRNTTNPFYGCIGVTEENNRPPESRAAALNKNEKGVLDEAKQKELETRCFNETIFVYDDPNMTRAFEGIEFEGGVGKEFDQDRGREDGFGKTGDDNTSLKQGDKRVSSGSKKKRRRRTTRKKRSGEEEEGKEGKKTSEEIDPKEKILKDIKERASVGSKQKSRDSGERKRASSGEKSEVKAGSFTMSGKMNFSKGEKEGLEVLGEKEGSDDRIGRYTVKMHKSKSKYDLHEALLEEILEDSHDEKELSGDGVSIDAKRKSPDGQSPSLLGSALKADEAKPDVADRISADTRISVAGISKASDSLTMPLSLTASAKVTSAMTEVREQGSAATMVGEQGSPATVVGEQGLAATMVGEQGLAVTMVGEQGSATTMVREPGSAATVVGEQGSAVTVVGDQGSAVTVVGEQGSAATVVGEQGSAATVVGEQGETAIRSAISEKKVKSPILSSIENLPFIGDDGSGDENRVKMNSTIDVGENSVRKESTSENPTLAEGKKSTTEEEVSVKEQPFDHQQGRNDRVQQRPEGVNSEEKAIKLGAASDDVKVDQERIDGERSRKKPSQVSGDTVLKDNNISSNGFCFCSPSQTNRPMTIGEESFGMPKTTSNVGLSMKFAQSVEKPMRSGQSGRSIEEQSKDQSRNHRIAAQATYNSSAYTDQVSVSPSPIKGTSVRAKASPPSMTTKSNRSWWRSRKKAGPSSRNATSLAGTTNATSGTDTATGTEAEKTPTTLTETTTAQMKGATETEGRDQRVERTADQGESGITAGSKRRDSGQSYGRKTTHNRYIVFKDKGFRGREAVRSEKFIINKIDNETHDWWRREDDEDTLDRSAAGESESNNNAETNPETTMASSDKGVFFERRRSFVTNSRRRRRMGSKNKAMDFVQR